MFDMRMREEAEGERRIMGSGRELGLRDGMGRPAEGAGTIAEGLTPGLTPGWPGRSRLRSKKTAALLRTWEKSWKAKQRLVPLGWPRSALIAKSTYCWLDSPKQCIPITRLALAIVDYL